MISCPVLPMLPVVCLRPAVPPRPVPRPPSPWSRRPPTAPAVPLPPPPGRRSPLPSPRLPRRLAWRLARAPRPCPCPLRLTLPCPLRPPPHRLRPTPRPPRPLRPSLPPRPLCPRPPPCPPHLLRPCAPRLRLCLPFRSCVLCPARLGLPPVVWLLRDLCLILFVSVWPLLLLRRVVMLMRRGPC